ncbi:MAG TPA: DUF5665 domain-containing protein [Candidatus Saccharimonadales bacterium]|nr:DUF5665 domain-containing protein [Candidatus Saccharimonadales bacterium]
MKKTKITPEDYEKLGRAVESALIDDYIDLLGNTRRQIKSAFVRGIFTGFGTVIGATVIVAVLIWILHLLGGLPFIGHYLQDAGSQLQQ